MSHEHKWELLHEVLPPAEEKEMTVVDMETGEQKVVPFDPAAFEGTVGFERDKPYRTEYCACGDKKVTLLTKQEAHDLAIRTGRIVVETLDLEGRSEAGAR